MGQQVLDSDGQFPDAVPGGVVDGVAMAALEPTCPISPTPLTPSGPGDVVFHLDEVDVDISALEALTEREVPQSVASR